MNKGRVAVAMSGGVDSSLAAALLKQEGYEVSGVYMRLWSELEHNILDLERTCQILDIPLHQLNFEAEFKSLVIDHFLREYSLGRTPNPCVTCNQRIKFGLLLDKVLQMDMDYLATGHYAQVESSPNGYRLLRAVDPDKDQSYFLYTLGQRELQHLLLPLGNRHKAEVRKLAAEMNLPISQRYDSQDICFIPDDDYRSFVARHILLKPGDIVDNQGKVLGKHNGLTQYTIGQRQGLGLASTERLYVIQLNATNNSLVVGQESQLLRDSLLASNLCWVSGEAPPKEPINIAARIRCKAPQVAAKLYINDGTAQVSFHEPQRAIAPGQSIVFYQGDTVLGGGIIEEGGYRG